ncbi:type VI secretion system tip protein VgrG [Roseateles amylovorans]|uniref:Type VI secretion system tip protein VgrG n=1 Tax=Roseateles amylovorans TaxID=2978473 RepID=A0ABY6B1Z8_9BURK|nr:type VI secretion system tip protein VgrG [Roseateles amylovorans]UXH79422.1 type VI secretion system tip protein VgrG [Roseateles amylovorans]
MPAASPIENAVGVVRLSILVDGNRLPETAELISVNIRRAVNTVPTARLVMTDGDMPAQTFPLSDSAHFKPGTTITVKAGYMDQEETLFEGLVVRHGIQVSGANDARLIVECRDKAVLMTVGRRNANFVDQKDSDIIATLAQGHGLEATVDATTATYTELVQHYCSDWDFMLARADANGMLVVAQDGALSIKTPTAAGEAALCVTYGHDLIEFDGDIDARTQYGSAQAFSWDMKNQAVLEGTAADPAALPVQGDLDSATLSEVIGLDALQLQAGAPQTEATLTQWAKALQVKAGLARVRGRVKFQGSAKAVVGGVMELKGCGARFSGKLFVTGVRHEIGDGNWFTEVDFGLAPDWFTDRPDVSATPAAGLLPGVHGLQVGVVMKLDADPAGEHRVQVKVPVLRAETEGVWARLMQFHASNAFGAFFLPEVGDEVVLGYFANDPSHPVVLGSLYSSKLTPPYAFAAENDTKAIVTRCKSRIEFNEADKIITITTPGKNKVVLSDKDKSILLEDQNQNKVELSPSGIVLDSPKNIEITAKGTITLDAVGKISVSSKADVKSAGMNVMSEAQIAFSAKGNASAELNSTGQTVVKGGLVMIN